MAAFISGQKRGVVGIIKRELRRRSAIEPLIGHIKDEGHLGRAGGAGAVSGFRFSLRFRAGFASMGSGILRSDQMIFLSYSIY